MQATSMQCPFPNCLVYKPSRFTLIKHLNYEHGNASPSIVLQCKVSNCGGRYTSINSYRMHMLRKHLDLPIAFNISSATPPTSVTITNTAIDSSKNSSEMTEADTRYISTDIFETEPCFLQK